MISPKMVMDGLTLKEDTGPGTSENLNSRVISLCMLHSDMLIPIFSPYLNPLQNAL